VPCHVDGDVIGDVTSLTIEVLPAALRVARAVIRER
jgi:diacylglycerol kinase family enzyme